MISSETIEIVYSNLDAIQVHSREEEDYRELVLLRLTESGEIRDLEDENKRLLE